MRLIDADELMEHAARDKLDTRELIFQMIENAPTIVDKEKEDLRNRCNMIEDVSSYLDSQLKQERDFSRDIVRMVMNFQRKEQQYG